MESVMSEIRTKYPQTVNVVFLNILKPENQDLMKYFGVASIPTQVLLDKEGKEFFRHTGYISTADVEKIFVKRACS
jgi:thioredoxin 1